MANKQVDLTGHRFGRLIALRRTYENKRSMWLCRCDCGESKLVPYASLAYGLTRSCGCLQRELISKRTFRHGEARSPGREETVEYKTWAAMLGRCRNPKHQAYKNYGGRGITVCDRWLTFENFLADMGRRPSKELSIDRINNDGNYEPGNCRWATRKEQIANQRKPKLRVVK
jgi:hypothetical protein